MKFNAQAFVESWMIGAPSLRLKYVYWYVDSERIFMAYSERALEIILIKIYKTCLIWWAQFSSVCVKKCYYPIIAKKITFIMFHLIWMRCMERVMSLGRVGAFLRRKLLLSGADYFHQFRCNRSHHTRFIVILLIYIVSKHCAYIYQKRLLPRFCKFIWICMQCLAFAVLWLEERFSLMEGRLVKAIQDKWVTLCWHFNSVRTCLPISFQ